MFETSIQLQRLQRVYETAKNSLIISTQVALAASVTAAATTYQMDISFSSTRNEWSIARRYSEFYAVRQQLRRFVKHYKQHYSSGASCPAPLVVLEKALESPFPRRHFRCDNNGIITERRAALELFVQSLVTVTSSILIIADIDATNWCGTTAEAKQLLVLYTVLRDFLEYPDIQIESEAKLKKAVLSLEDVVVDSRSHVWNNVESISSSECCSICLSEWGDEECVGMNVVKLPCMHIFHEECLFEWLQGTTHCPMCREEPATSASRYSLDGSCMYQRYYAKAEAAIPDRHTYS